MSKKVKIFSIIGAIFVCSVGTLLHYAYDWSGENAFIALFSGVNESTWEHLKLFYIPFFVFTLIEYAVYGKKLDNFFTVKLLASLLGMGFITVSYYTITGVIGKNISWINIAIFFISTFIAYIYSYRKLIKKPLLVSPRTDALSSVAMAVIAGLFFIFTYYTPTIGIFMDPTTLGYGVTGK